MTILNRVKHSASNVSVIDFDHMLACWVKYNHYMWENICSNQVVGFTHVFFKHFASKNQLPGFYICGTLVDDGLMFEIMFDRL